MTPQQSRPSVANASGKSKPTDARAEILQHAKLLFRQKGFSAVSMNDLVSSVGLTKPTIYYHFTDKETLFTEVVVEMMRHGNEMLVAGMKRCKDFREKLYRLSEGYFRFSPTSLSTMVRDASEHLDEAHMKRVMEAHRFYLINPIIGIFEEARQAGEIARSENPDTLALYFISWIDAMTTLRTAHEGRDFDPRECASKMVDIFVEGIRLRPDSLTESHPQAGDSQ
ncbi:TetR/AcrR family transcriptional regulator [Vampirovibrio chlorellavorus]|uniref:TetR/AcrR family transcriptional regulator n=1 Tax=Vampirovibrio chlorellavorus TaxID=758823 RepID=UPI0026EC2168|nr:TetR/AcrR family transcriptional regulator [Vampirovibrio chlorellavorus]